MAAAAAAAIVSKAYAGIKRRWGTIMDTVVEGLKATPQTRRVYLKAKRMFAPRSMTPLEQAVLLLVDTNLFDAHQAEDFLMSTFTVSDKFRRVLFDALFRHVFSQDGDLCSAELAAHPLDIIARRISISTSCFTAGHFAAWLHERNNMCRLMLPALAVNSKDAKGTSGLSLALRLGFSDFPYETMLAAASAETLSDSYLLDVVKRTGQVSVVKAVLKFAHEDGTGIVVPNRSLRSNGTAVDAPAIAEMNDAIQNCLYARERYRANIRSDLTELLGFGRTPQLVSLVIGYMCGKV